MFTSHDVTTAADGLHRLTWVDPEYRGREYALRSLPMTDTTNVTLYRLVDLYGEVNQLVNTG